MPKGTCSVEGCEATSRSRGLCPKHYMQWWRGEHGGETVARRGTCTIDGCDNAQAAKGWCPMHYQRWVRHGDPLAQVGKWTRRLEPLPRGHGLTPEELRLRHRSRTLLATYGITHEEYEAMAEAQQHRCGLCRQQVEAPRLANGTPLVNMVVDHDHATGAVRSLLCAACNLALGRVERMGLDRIVSYLSR